VQRLNTHVAFSVFSAIVLVLLIIVGLDAITAFIDEAEDIGDGYTFVEVLKYVGLTLPGRFYEFIPFAALIGCLIGLGQLATSSELVVMRAAGVSTARLTWIAMKPALLIAVFGFVIGEYVAPKTDQWAATSRALAQNPGESIAGRRGLWHRESNSFLNFNALESNGVVHGITLLQFDDNLRLLSTLSARRATFQGDHWLMEQVKRTNLASWGTQRSEHTTLRWETGITPQILTMEVVAPEQLPLLDLYRYSRYLLQQGLDADDFQLALWRKLLQPLAIAALVLVAISFIFGPLREGTMGFRIFAGVIVGIAFRTSQDLLGPASLVFGFSPLYAAVAPIAICAVAGFMLLSRAR
jgi:lipopolysaccharide export system permease protein